MSRILGAENIGIFSYTYAIANYFVLFANLGIKNYGSRTIAMVRNNKEEMNQRAVKLIAGVMADAIIEGRQGADAAAAEAAEAKAAEEDAE